MTISTTSNKAQWAANGVTTVFSFSFEIPEASQAALYLISGSTITLLSPGAYTLSGLGNPAGGTVTYPLTGPALAAGNMLVLLRTLTLQQLVDLVNQSNYYPDAVEGGMDYLMMVIQQLATNLACAIQAPLTDDAPDMELPAAAARAGMLLAFDPNGNVTLVSASASVGAGNMTAELGLNGHPGFKAGTDFTAGTTETLTLSQAYGTVANVFVAFDGGYQERDSYIITGNQITFGSWSGNTFTPAPIPAYVTNVDVIGGTTLSIFTPAAGTVGAAQLAYAISGTTAQRPAGAPNGWGYLDTSLSTYGTPIMRSSLSGTGWVNSAGAQV
jgi:hypothetical protein